MWSRREILGALGTGIAGVTLSATKVEAAQGQSAADDPKHAGMKKSCCDTCGECAEACNKAFHHCVDQAAAGKAQHARMAQIAADCGAFCALSAQMIARHSMMMVHSCRACADACRQCAKECQSFDTDLEMKVCLAACEKCEESCRSMVKAMGSA